MPINCHSSLELESSKVALWLDPSLRWGDKEWNFNDKNWYFYGILISCLFLIFIFSCASESDSAIKKAHLEGEWYFKTTIVDKKGENDTAFIGLSCPLERIKFNIAKDKLLAYRANSNSKDLIAAFPIINELSHEIKVDLSHNLSSRMDCNGWLNSITIIRSFKTQKIENDYMEAVTEALIEPSSSHCEMNLHDCSPSLYRVKFSFKKVPTDNDYQKRHYPDFEYIYYGQKEDDICLKEEPGCTNIRRLYVYNDQLQRKLCNEKIHDQSDCIAPSIKLNAQFGYFRSEKTEQNNNKEQLINRWNIWQKSIDERNNVIPIKDRTPKKIVFYLSPNFPKYLWPEVKIAEEQWNMAFLNVMTKTKNLKDITEAKKIFGSIFEIRPNDCELDNVKTFIKKHNISFIKIEENNLSNTCGALEDYGFLWQSLGDLRYSFVNLVMIPEETGLLGYGPLSADPDTGEIINGVANIYWQAIKDYAESSVKMMERTYDFAFSGLELKRDEDNFLMKNINLLKNLKQDSEDNLKKQVFLSSRNACFFDHNLDVPYFSVMEELKDLDFQEKIKVLEKRIFLSVLLHELGHTFGLRHNFKGAHDALNFPKEFWEEKNKRELRSSSIMTYHKHFNGGFFGLGLYDHAAILSGYGERLEIFDEDIEAFVPKRFLDNLNLMTYSDLPYLFSKKDNSKKIIDHYLKIKDEHRRGNTKVSMDFTNLNITPQYQNIYLRKTADVMSLKQNLFNKVLNGKQALYPVPYQFCSDEKVNGMDLSCRPFSYGASAYEIVKSTFNDFFLWQKTNTSPINIQSYLVLSQNRIYVPIFKLMSYLSLLKEEELDIYPIMNDYLKASELSLSYMSKILQIVDPGLYCLDKENNYVLSKNNLPCREGFTVNKDEGKEYNNIRENNLSGKVLRVGSVYDKSLALMALTNQDMGFYKLWPEKIDKVLLNIFIDKWQNLGPTLEKNNDVIKIGYKNLFFDNLDKNTLRIVPTSSKYLKKLAVMLSLNNQDIRSKWDFFKKEDTGREEIFTISDKVDRISFQDPITLKTYVAQKAKNDNHHFGFFLIKDIKENLNKDLNKALEKIKILNLVKNMQEGDLDI